MLLFLTIYVNTGLTLGEPCNIIFLKVMSMGIFDGILLCTDLDGTFLHHAEASAENCRAIRYFQENGGLFTVATGRSAAFVHGFENYAPNAPLIVSNGTLICDHLTKQPLVVLELPEYTCAVLDELHDDRLLNEVFLYDLNDGGTDISDQEYRHWNPQMGGTPGEYISHMPRPWIKILLEMKSPKDNLALQRHITARYPGMFETDRSYELGLELHAPHTGKGKCIEILRGMLPGIRLTVGAGDYENDISLLRCADIGYAVANALPEVRAAADRVTVSCEEHAIAKIIDDLKRDVCAGR